MRPYILDPLFRPLTVLPGIGPRNAKLLEKLVGGPKILDVLWHKPIDVIDRRHNASIKDLKEGQIVTLRLRVQKHFPGQTKSQPTRVWCSNDTGAINLVFFHAREDWIKKQLPENADVVASGKVEFFNGQPQIIHPDAIGKPEDYNLIAIVEPVYPLTAGLTNKAVRKAVNGALSSLPDFPEWQDAEFKKRKGWGAWKEDMRQMHQAPPLPARLAYDELLANQLALAMVRAHQRSPRGRIFPISSTLRPKIIKALPFTLTGAQQRSLQEIDADMAQPQRMLRLLQGDVGSGKTVVAALAMANVIEAGFQAALMAPTEILARQHAQSLKPWLDAAGIKHVTLTGRDKASAREQIMQALADGSAQIVIGTHALFQDAVAFHNLGLAVIDEQHRFGVHQRLLLSQKGKGVDVLVMTATPIPRTLTLTAYGDMDVSRLDEKPPGRKPIDTRLIPVEKTDAMIDGLRRRVADGARAYWVCPLVQESEVMDLAAAEARFDHLRQIFGSRVGLVHGRLKPAEKDDVMARFAAGDLDILVATTVIEVGVDVPQATVMVIEQAERFGLSQLHQLRGRVGRGMDQSYCFLLYTGPLNETAKERLGIMRQTEDGFLIAEKDLELRGAGDVLGVRQSGLAEFHLADLMVHGELLQAARDDARLILARDPELQSERGQALRTLLYLFERDQAIAYLRSG